MGELPDATFGWLVWIPNPEYQCQVCSTWREEPAIYQFRTDSRESVFFCAECMQQYLSPEHEAADEERDS
jgi:hypothetical protein